MLQTKTVHESITNQLNNVINKNSFVLMGLSQLKLSSIKMTIQCDL